MAIQFKEKYRNSQRNGTIGASSKEIMCNETADIQAKRLHGSFNFVTISNTGNDAFRLRLDGLESREINVGSGTSVTTIKAEDGVYFDTIELIDSGGAGLTQDEFTFVYGRADPID